MAVGGIADPAASPQDRIPTKALVRPNYSPAADTGSVTLGCGGTLILRFVDNVLFDVPGPDLYVFEVGPAIEPTSLAISRDGQNWLEIGKISGGRAEVDIHPIVRANDYFYYVWLTDLKSGCDGRWPGADIDAVVAIGSGLNIRCKTPCFSPSTAGSCRKARVAC